MEAFVPYLKSLKKELNIRIQERKEIIDKFNKKSVKGKQVSTKNHNIILNEVFHLEDLLSAVNDSIKLYLGTNPKI